MSKQGGMKMSILNFNANYAVVYNLGNLCVCEKDLESIKYKNAEFGKHYFVAHVDNTSKEVIDGLTLDEAIDYCYGSQNIQG